MVDCSASSCFTANESDAARHSSGGWMVLPLSAVIVPNDRDAAKARRMRAIGQK